MNDPHPDDDFTPQEAQERFEATLRGAIKRPSRPSSAGREPPTPAREKEIFTVSVAPPASGQFEAQMSSRKLAIHNSGISVSKVRAEWLESLGLSENQEEPEQRQSIDDTTDSHTGSQTIPHRADHS